MHKFTEWLEHDLIEFCSDGATAVSGQYSLALFNPLPAKNCYTTTWKRLPDDK
jgi:hypothetical protein